MARRRARRGTGGTGYDRHRGRHYARVYTRDATGKRVAHRIWAEDAYAADEALKVLRARYGIDADEHEPPPGVAGEAWEEGMMGMSDRPGHLGTGRPLLGPSVPRSVTAHAQATHVRMVYSIP